ncbi:MAG: 2-amino-4-hydroxy-6-hydroxymethyldihydropteridine diphosphokinase [Phycisphaerales bacterium]|nr:2-amino-4-hydroxy-6-hydroxymethyldihydropteridine diphosphokinase [Phycisphaerales bacterium]
MPPPAQAFIGLGSNVGDRRGHLRAALTSLADLPETTLLAVSTFRETEPVGPVAQGPFLNAVASVETGLQPRRLLESLQAIERSRGRDRAGETRWGPRTLDLDILIYADVKMCEPGLTIPHPRLSERLFVLEPLAEIAPDTRVPSVGGTVLQLFERLQGHETAGGMP